jgi:carbamoyltransferase
MAPRLHALLEAYGARSGLPILLNTSFNLAGEPIVCTPLDALRTFWSSGIDVLVLEDVVIRKRQGTNQRTES